MATHWWQTEYRDPDGETYVGPLVEADSRAAADAMLSCLRGPAGERLDIASESWMAEMTLDVAMKLDDAKTRMS